MYFRENAWWVSPYNDREEVKGAAWPGQRVTIHDATLRDGEQTPEIGRASCRERVFSTV